MNLFNYKNYHDDEYIEYLHYFNFKYFKDYIAKFSKNNNEERKETNKLRGVLLDVQKIGDKINTIKFEINKLNNKDIIFLKQSMTQINTIFAILENNLFEAQTDEIFKTFLKGQQKPGVDKISLFGKGLLSKTTKELNK